MSPESPCIGVCELAPGESYCAGCFRTLAEIAAWYRLTDAEKSQALTATAVRRQSREVQIAEQPNLPAQRIVSLLPAATEMAFALGLGSRIVAVTHECNFPPEARMKPVIVRPALDMAGMSPGEVDAAVSNRLAAGQSLYAVDEALLRQLKPDLILTQDLCEVCAPSGNDLAVALKQLQPAPRILSLSPRSLNDIHENLRALGHATGRTDEAERLVADGRDRLEFIVKRTVGLSRRPRVFFMEWADPVYCAGHWIPEMVEMAGGLDALAKKGTDSARIPWQAVLEWAPEVLVFSPCGFKLEEVLRQTAYLQSLPGWADLPAVRHGRAYAVDADAYFARPGPRVVDGTELLAHLIHPELFSWKGSADAYREISTHAATISFQEARHIHSIIND
jgi:iron complex transport system substrate-binding protein